MSAIRVAEMLLLAILSSPTGLVAQDRIPPRPIREPAAFVAAVGNGTRSNLGGPGAAYWQQQVDYHIDASLDVTTGRVAGAETIIYHNNSPDALDRLVLHLDQNVFAPGARRNRRAPVTGGITLGPVTVDGIEVETSHPGNGYYNSLTLLVVSLPGELKSGDSAVVELDWEFTVPPAPTFRNGNQDGEIFAVAQWYPRLAVYDDVYGWDASPYLGDGEFYMEYGDFEVALTVPSGWLIGATGELVNPDEALSPAAAQRFAGATRSAATTHVVSADGRGSGVATSGVAGESVTWRFRASNVRDFAWSTSQRYVWDVAAINDSVYAQAFYDPRLDAWERGVDYVAHTVRSFSEYLGEYAYPQLTITQGPVGGMEYPMLVFNPGTNNAAGLAGVTVHEGAHQWFPMMVGSMEAKHTWMDEGLVSYWDEISSAALAQREPRRGGENRFYLAFAGTEAEVPLMRRTDLVNPYGARGLAAYTKPAVLMGALREVLGDEVFEAAFQRYFRQWQFKHPQPWDFFNTFERIAGRDLDWFWRPFFFETDVLDQSVEYVLVHGQSATVRISDLGEVVLPAIVEVQFDDGRTVVELIPESHWLRGNRSYEFTVGGGVRRVTIDPEGRFPDVDRSNNSWVAN